MKEIASLSEIKTSLTALTGKEVRDLCLRMARYKKENKELLSYLLFFAANESDYVSSIQAGIDEQLDSLNRSNNYYSLKGIRKVLRLTNKHIKFSGIRQTEVELLIYFCRCLKEKGFMKHPGTSLINLYERQLIKTRKAIGYLHEDLQFDYTSEIQNLNL